jgi:hypothetical protein
MPFRHTLVRIRDGVEFATTDKTLQIREHRRTYDKVKLSARAHSRQIGGKKACNASALLL